MPTGLAMASEKTPWRHPTPIGGKSCGQIKQYLGKLSGKPTNGKRALHKNVPHTRRRARRISEMTHSHPS
jgi:hypothetical protein